METEASQEEPSTPRRRDFLTEVVTVLLSAPLVLAPLAAGVLFFIDPLRRSKRKASLVRLIPLREAPTDGRPVATTVLGTRTDAWNRAINVPLGRVLVRRLPDENGQPRVQAFNAACPHAGCYVGYRSEPGDEPGVFKCPCHNSVFALDGETVGHTPSPRGLDELPTEIRGPEQAREIWVEFKNFYTGREEKIPK